MSRGPIAKKNKWEVAFSLKNSRDESVFLTEYVVAEAVEFLENEKLLRFYDHDDLGEPVFKALFRDFLYAKQVDSFLVEEPQWTRDEQTISNPQQLSLPLESAF